jgi:hypothetical protein
MTTRVGVPGHVGGGNDSGIPKRTEVDNVHEATTGVLAQKSMPAATATTPANASEPAPYWPAAAFDGLVADADELPEPDGLVEAEPLGELSPRAVPVPVLDGAGPEAVPEPPDDGLPVGAAPPRPIELGVHDVDACGFDWTVTEPEKPCAPLESLTASDLRCVSCGGR